MHRGHGDMREVDDHPDAVHLGDDLPAELAQPPDPGLVGCRVRPAAALVVGQGQVADPQPVEVAQDRQRRGDAVAALRAQQRGDATAGHRPAAVVGPGGQHQAVGMERDHPVDQVDLLQGHRERLGLGEGRWRVHRPELGADPARPQPCQVGVGPTGQRGARVEGAEVTPGQPPDLPGKVVVAVEDGRLGEHGPRGGDPPGCPRLGRARLIHGRDAAMSRPRPAGQWAVLPPRAAWGRARGSASDSSAVSPQNPTLKKRSTSMALTKSLARADEAAPEKAEVGRARCGAGGRRDTPGLPAAGCWRTPAPRSSW